ncbi:hypothetical protein, partial [Escherichia coli]|uniref:hypothetical protein n=1 Tax=Escherichia coli TaxID=562 RepID=UPI0019D4BB8A
ILTFQNHTNRPLTDFGGKTSIFSHPVYLFLREFSLQDFRGGSNCWISSSNIIKTKNGALSVHRCMTHAPSPGC